MKKMILLTLTFALQSALALAANTANPNHCLVTEQKGREVEKWVLELKTSQYSMHDDTAAQPGFKLFKNISSDIGKTTWDGKNKMYYVYLYKNTLGDKRYLLNDSQGAIFIQTKIALDAQKNDSIKIECPTEE